MHGNKAVKTKGIGQVLLKNATFQKNVLTKVFCVLGKNIVLGKIHFPVQKQICGKKEKHFNKLFSL